MVFRGQDAWRKHPLLAGGWKAPFPGLKLATGIFAAYLVIDAVSSLGSKGSHDHGSHSSGAHAHAHTAAKGLRYEFQEMDQVPRLTK